MNYKDIITVKSDKSGDNLCVRGLRMTVQDVLEYLTAGKTEADILKEFPSLTSDDIIACLVYGADGEEVSPKIRSLQFDLMMKKSTNERVAIAGEMFTAVRQAILDSLPKDLSEKEIKKQLYFRTYGEHLPEDFFKD